MNLIYIIIALLGVGVVFYGGRRIVKDPMLGVCLFVFLSSVTISYDLPIIQDRLVAADFIMMFTIVICMFQGQFFRPPLPGLKLVDQLGFCFICAAVISSIFAIMTGGDLVRASLFLFIYIYGYCCFRLIVRLITSRRDLERILLWWAAAATLVIIVGFLAASGIYKPAWTFDPKINRISSTFKGSGQVASYLGPALFILFYMASSRLFSRKIHIVSAALIFAGAFVLLSAGSRIGFVIMVLSVIAGLWIILTTRLKGFNKIPLYVMSILASFSFFSFAIAVWADRETEYGLLTTAPAQRAIKLLSEQFRSGISLETIGGTRHDEISTVIQNFENHMFLGTGSGLFSRTYRINEVHNTYFSILGENGLIAFLIFMLWWGVIFIVLSLSIKRALGENRLILKLVTCAFAVLSIYQVTTNGMRQRPFWFLPSIALVASSILTRPSLQNLSRPLDWDNARR